MNLSKKEVQSIYQSEPGRIKIKPIDRFLGKEWGPCGNNILVDDQRTNVLLCLLCREDPAKSRSAFYMVSGTKNESTNAKSHFEHNHVARVNKNKRTGDQGQIMFPIQKKCRFAELSKSDIDGYQKKAAIAICKSNLALDFMASDGAEILIKAFLGKILNLFINNLSKLRFRFKSDIKFTKRQNENFIVSYQSKNDRNEWHDL